MGTFGLVIIGVVTVGFVVAVLILFPSRKDTPRPLPVLVRNKLASIKNGQRIKVHGSSGYIFNAMVINNMPSEEKMLIQIVYSNGTYSGQEVAKYNSDTFKEFNVLNVVEIPQIKLVRVEPKITDVKYFYNATFDLYEQAVNNQKTEEASILREAVSKIESIKT